MRKPVLAIALMILSQAPVFSATKPSDIVNIMNIQGETEETMTEKIYAKPWSAIKLDAKTRAKLNAINAKLDKDSGLERFKLIWIRLGNDDIQTVMFMGHLSTVWVYNFIGSEERCYATVAGNGRMSGCFE
jgi:hypothetical protein